MNKPVAAALLVAGLLLLAFGMNASDSLGSTFTRFFTGAPTDRTIWFLLAGAVASVAGLAGLLRQTKHP